MDRVLVVCGPTGVGKTKISIDLAKKLNGEIINVDSMQVYKEMSIGTAKIKEEEKDGVPHHLFDILSVEDNCNVADFQKLVREKIKEVTDKGKLPILVGGTGLYVKAVVYDYVFVETNKKTNFEEYSNEELYKLLKEKDPVSAEKFHQNNRKRIERALSIVENVGESKSSLEEKQEHELVYDTIFLTLTMDREKLYERINYRVDLMFEEGLEEEARRIYELNIPGSTSLQAIGYKEFIPYFEGKISLSEVKENIQKNSRHYAKRQYTWLRNQIKADWLDVLNKTREETLLCAINIINERWGDYGNKK